MSDPKPTYQSKMYCVHEHPFAYATLTDFGPGQGLLQIHSDWGTYSNFWGSMGERTIAEFVVETSPSYLEQKLTYQMNYMGVKKEAFGRLTKFMAQCWPRLKDEILKDLQSVDQSVKVSEIVETLKLEDKDRSLFGMQTELTHIIGRIEQHGVSR